MVAATLNRIYHCSSCCRHAWSQTIYTFNAITFRVKQGNMSLKSHPSLAYSLMWRGGGWPCVRDAQSHTHSRPWREGTGAWCGRLGVRGSSKAQICQPTEQYWIYRVDYASEWEMGRRPNRWRHRKPKSRLIFEKESLELIQHKDLSPM